MCHPSKIDVSPFEDRCNDVSTFGDRCVDFRRSMCRPSEMDVLTFDDRCVDLRRSVIDVSTFNIDGRCEIRLLYLLKVLIL